MTKEQEREKANVEEKRVRAVVGQRTENKRDKGREVESRLESDQVEKEK